MILTGEHRSNLKKKLYQCHCVHLLDWPDTELLAYPGILFGGGGSSTNSVEDRENRDLGAVAP